MRRRRSKQKLILKRMIVAAAAVLCCLLVVVAFIGGGWDTKDGAVRYLDTWGKPKTGWQEIGGSSYYFAPHNGAMVTGWADIDGTRYYFSQDGKRASGCQELDGKKYYFAENGALSTGWIELDGKRYYAGQDGSLTVGWLQLDGKRYYFDQNGQAATGLTVLDGISYQFQEDGSIMTGWFEDANGKYYYDESGTLRTGWLQWEQKTYYLDENGYVTTGWMELEGDRYYFLPTGRMAIGEVEIDGISRFFSSKGKEVLMCNPWHAIPDDFVLDLVDAEGFKFDRNTKEPLEQMFAAARKDGVYVEVNNSYRSIETQQYKWDRKVAERMAQGMTKEEAERITGQSLAIPGHSEHHTGLAMDINSGGGSYEWMAENCWDYGFIVRYPDDHLDITGIIYEPWHFRYVGVELAQELKNYCCMEEYFAELTQQQKNIAD